MARHHSHYFRIAASAAVGLTIWLLSTEPAGLGMLQLVVFMAPGALLGIGWSWAANATRPSAWSWYAARRAAWRGSLVLPPLIAFIIGLDGNDRRPQLLVGFVRSAWLALALGGAVGIARLLRAQAIRSKRRRRALQQARHQHRANLQHPARQ